MTSPSTDAVAVAQFLQANPDFFDQHAELLAHMYVPHPLGGELGPHLVLPPQGLSGRRRELEDGLQSWIVELGPRGHVD